MKRLTALTLAPGAVSRNRSAHLSRVTTLGLVLLAALFGVGVLALMLGVTPIAPAKVLAIVFTGEGERVPSPEPGS